MFLIADMQPAPDRTDTINTAHGKKVRGKLSVKFGWLTRIVIELVRNKTQGQKQYFKYVCRQVSSMVLYNNVFYSNSSLITRLPLGELMGKYKEATFYLPEHSNIREAELSSIPILCTFLRSFRNPLHFKRASLVQWLFMQTSTLFKISMRMLSIFHSE